MKSRHQTNALHFMAENGSITTKDMNEEFGDRSPRDTIYELRKLGHNIISKGENGINRYGIRVHYIRYVLEKGERC